MSSHKDLQIMSQVARLYYEKDMTQQEIARKVGLSRQKVSRLLTRARQEGVVRITILDPRNPDHALEMALKEEFGLQNVVLAASEGLVEHTLRRQIGIAAAHFLTRTLEQGQQVGIGWGRTLEAMVNAVNFDSSIEIHVIPLLGGIGDMAPSFQVNELALRLAEELGGTFQFFHLPAFVYDREAWEILMRTDEVERISHQWSKVRPAVVGIGQIELQKFSSVFFTEGASPPVVDVIEGSGVVGDICGRFYDIDGQSIELGGGVIGISMDAVRELPEVIAVAGGLPKVRAITGALRGGI
ncbi:MAG: winged helix-turn-helix transcriptional regulator, partial [Anaerolineales bacterium]|nr:winged helix-turn-helix transcriptional regulator [Anaerolineales bacterium]